MKRCDNCGAPATGKPCRYCGRPHESKQTLEDIQQQLKIMRAIGAALTERLKENERKQ